MKENLIVDTPFKVTKVDEDRRLVFGIFNVTTKGGEPVVDTQDEVIETATLEDAAYKFVLKVRSAGREHQQMEVGTLVESVVLTKEKQEAIQSALDQAGISGTIKIDAEFWWGGFFIESTSVWESIKSGKFRAFSIGGMATRTSLD